MTIAVLMLRHVLYNKTLYRAQGSLLLLAITIPVLASIAFLTLPAIDFDISPMAFGAASLLVWLAIDRFRLMSVMPVAHRTVFESITDAVFVINEDDTVIDFNDAAREVPGVDDDVLGAPVDGVLDSFPDETLRAVRDSTNFDREIQVEASDNERYYWMTVVPVADSTNRVMVLRDSTTRKQYQAELERRQEKLDIMRQVFARVLRHNIRNDLTVVRGWAEVIADSGDETQADMAHRILDQSDELLSTTEKARIIESIVMGEGRRRRFDVMSLLDDVVSTFEREYVDIDLSLEYTDDAAAGELSVFAHEQLPTAVENLIENGIIHNKRSDSPELRVDVSRMNGTVAIRVKDNGPGIPPDELAVLDRWAESSLTHGSGAGLWATNFIVDESDGSLDFDTGGEYTTATIRLPAA